MSFKHILFKNEKQQFISLKQILKVVERVILQNHTKMTIILKTCK